MGVTGRRIVLTRRPSAREDFDCFEEVEGPVPDPGEGEVLIQCSSASVDPSMIPRLSVDTYAPRFTIGEPVQSRLVGRIVQSRCEDRAAGDWVLCTGSWQEFVVADGTATTPIDPSPGVPPEMWLGALGAPGLTAYTGLELMGLTAGETIWVSAAAGAVGSVAAQLAKARGAACVIGSASGPDKCRYLREQIGVDVAIDYRNGDLADELRALAPAGLDVYFDNVGGDHLEAALGAMRIGGRIAACGMISGYGAKGPASPRNISEVIIRRLRLQGFLVTDHDDLRASFENEARALLADGRLAAPMTAFSGPAAASRAMAALLGGAEKLGKVMITFEE
ncbi:zinc-binding dehydrogenase [Tsukamurella spumae]|uniref:zinc-binding dehydrogenase n=1 Tax=Tsukamurella spumae TaxID=44753 RepID=UPI001FEB6A94